MLGLIATRSIDDTGAGHSGTRSRRAKARIESGMIAYDALEKLRGRTAPTPRRARNVQGPCRRSRLRAAAQALYRRPAQGRRRDDRQGGAGHRAERRAAVLVVPRHGRRSASTSSPLFACAFWLRRPSATSTGRWFLRLLPVRAAAAVDRGRARLVRRRIRPPALGDRRRAADLPRVVVAVGLRRCCSRWAASSCSIRAARRRRDPDAQIHRAWGRQGARRLPPASPRPPRAPAE